jgi:hypothetical protein
MHEPCQTRNKMLLMQMTGATITVHNNYCHHRQNLMNSRISFKSRSHVIDKVYQKQILSLA